MKKKQKTLTEEEKEDLRDILRSEEEGFGVISEGYRCKKTKRTIRSNGRLKRRLF